MKKLNGKFKKKTLIPKRNKLKTKSERYIELDALRGLAALSVFISHVRSINPSGWYLFELTPLNIVSAGHAAVIFFFILSGFVLSLQMFSENSLSYSSFLVRRFFRIYVPYIACIFLALIIFLVIKRNSLLGLSSWAHAVSNPKISLKLIFEYILMLGSFPNFELNPAIWTLIVEMRVALIFPLVIKLIKNTSIKIYLPFFLILSILGEAIHKQVYLYGIDYFETLHFLLFFALGIILAKYKETIITFFKKIKFNLIISILGVCFYSYGSLIYYVLQDNKNFSFITQLISDWIIGFGALVIMISVLSRESDFLFLKNKIFQFLGKISFSFYLYHALILIVVLNLLYKNIYSLFFIFPLSFIITIFISSLSYKFIEMPSNTLGKKITRTIFFRQSNKKI